MYLIIMINLLYSPHLYIISHLAGTLKGREELKQQNDY
jgi:hypothetical protein